MDYQNISKQARYNLNVVVKETGIKPDALRAWEKRYNLPLPTRSSGGHRLYSDYDIQVIKWLQNRQREGMRIGQAADYWNEVEESGVNPLSKVPSGIHVKRAPGILSGLNQTIIQLQERWIDDILDYDEEGADQILTQAFAQFPLEIVCDDLISSGLNKIGDKWYEGTSSVQQEHFASELVGRKIQALLTTAPRPIHDKVLMIFCPAGENHSIPVLILNLLLRYRGWQTLYLGANVPTVKLSETISKIKPDLAILSASRLSTAAALLDSVMVLAEYNTSAVYGGRIFDEVQGLTDQIPAHYLNYGLSGSLPVIEEIINKPFLPAINNPNSPIGSRELFNKTRYQIDNAIIQHFAQTVPQGFLKKIQEANVFLAQEIISASTFGNMDFINPDLLWVEGLMGNLGLNKGFLKQFLEQYQIAVDNYMGEDGQFIKNWLSVFTAA